MYYGYLLVNVIIIKGEIMVPGFKPSEKDISYVENKYGTKTDCWSGQDGAIDRSLFGMAAGITGVVFGGAAKGKSGLTLAAVGAGTALLNANGIRIENNRFNACSKADFNNVDHSS
jgi:hypothetical protein